MIIPAYGLSKEGKMCIIDKSSQEEILVNEMTVGYSVFNGMQVTAEIRIPADCFIDLDQERQLPSEIDLSESYDTSCFLEDKQREIINYNDRKWW